MLKNTQIVTNYALVEKESNGKPLAYEFRAAAATTSKWDKEWIIFSG